MDTSPLPHDLARPRRDRRQFVGGVAAGVALLLVLAGTVLFGLFVR